MAGNSAAGILNKTCFLFIINITKFPGLGFGKDPREKHWGRGRVTCLWSTQQRSSWSTVRWDGSPGPAPPTLCTKQLENNSDRINLLTLTSRNSTTTIYWLLPHISYALNFLTSPWSRAMVNFIDNKASYRDEVTYPRWCPQQVRELDSNAPIQSQLQGLYPRWHRWVVTPGSAQSWQVCLMWNQRWQARVWPLLPDSARAKRWSWFLLALPLAQEAPLPDIRRISHAEQPSKLNFSHGWLCFRNPAAAYADVLILWLNRLTFTYFIFLRFIFITFSCVCTCVCACTCMCA